MSTEQPIVCCSGRSASSTSRFVDAGLRATAISLLAVIFPWQRPRHIASHRHGYLRRFGTASNETIPQ